MIRFSYVFSRTVVGDSAVVAVGVVVVVSIDFGTTSSADRDQAAET